MSGIDYIDLAVKSHILWKEELVKSINTGKSDYTATQLKSPHSCQFGKWLNGVEQEVKDTTLYEEIYELHSIFHLEAGKILECILKDKKEDALDLMSESSLFIKTSSLLTDKLLEWKF